MKKQTVGDVLGLPNTWPNQFSSSPDVPLDMKGAVISEFVDIDDRVIVFTVGSDGGHTLSVFPVDDAALRKRIIAVLKIGLTAWEATALVI